MIDHDDAGFLLQLGRVVGGQADWPELLRLLCGQLRADSAWLFHAPHCWGSAGADHALTPGFVAGLRIGRVYGAEELRERAFGADPLLAGSDLRMIGMVAQPAPAWLLVRRGKGAFAAADSARLSAYAPHLGQALALWAQHHAAEAQAMQAADLAQRMAVGVVRLEISAQRLHPDSMARALLAEHRCDTAALLRAAREQPLPVVLSLAPALEAVIVAGPIAFLRQTQGTLPPPDLIAHLLAIPRAEARLAHALGEGATLAQAAARLGLSIETARNYSKRIYAATGLGGQAALIRRLWAGALPLARPPGNAPPKASRD
ncbi:MAG: hypothetical protein JJT99_09575 [Rhodobacteraceae bacterium]|nr:hypothetical protein [Paracoccaceae bacterium]